MAAIFSSLWVKRETRIFEERAHAILFD